MEQVKVIWKIYHIDTMGRPRDADRLQAIREVALTTGVPERTLQDWILRGIIPKSHDIRVMVQAIIGYYRNQIAELKSKKSGKDDLYDEQVRLTRLKADQVELKIREAEGELVKAQEVAAVWSGYLVSCRAKLLGIPSKLAYELAGLTDPNLVRESLESVISEALEELSGEDFARRTRTIDSDGDGTKTAAAVDGEPVGGSVSEAIPGSERRTGAMEDGEDSLP